MDQQFLQEAIQLRLKQEVQKYLERNKEEFERMMPEIVAGIVVDLMKMTEFQTMSDRIIFTIKKT